MTDLDPTAAHLHHLLLVDEVVTTDDVGSLLRSHYPPARWAGRHRLGLVAGLGLSGPWTVGPELRRRLDAPAWAERAWLTVCPQERGTEVPEALRGLDALMDAYPFAAPEGVELRTLMFLRAGDPPTAWAAPPLPCPPPHGAPPSRMSPSPPSKKLLYRGRHHRV